MAVNRRKRRQSKHFPISSHREKPAKPEKQTIADMVTAWLSAHRPVFLFLLIFGVLMGLFYACALLLRFYAGVFPSYFHVNAELSGLILGFLGQDVRVAGDSISSTAFSVSIRRGCDAIEPIALFICAVLAFPTPFLRKILGIIAGVFFLVILNLVRVVTLFLIGVYFPKVFHLVHIDAWQALFIILTIIFWVLWLRWATQSQIPAQRASK